MLDTVEGMSELQRIRVVIADDQELVRAGFAMVIGSQPDIQVVGQAAMAPRRCRWPNRCTPMWC